MAANEQRITRVRSRELETIPTVNAANGDGSAVRFGVFELDAKAGELRRNGIKVKLQDQPFQVPTMLLERPGEVVSREELQRRLWSADTFVDFEPQHQCRYQAAARRAGRFGRQSSVR